MSVFSGIIPGLTDDKSPEMLSLTEEAKKINSAIAESLRSIGDVSEETIAAALPGRLIRAINLEYIADMFRLGPVLTIRICIPGTFSCFFAQDIRRRCDLHVYYFTLIFKSK
jgi:hypothetical protein